MQEWWVNIKNNGGSTCARIYTRRVFGIFIEPRFYHLYNRITMNMLERPNGNGDKIYILEYYEEYVKLNTRKGNRHLVMQPVNSFAIFPRIGKT